MALAPGISAAAVMAYVETLDSNIKVSTVMAYIEVEEPIETVRVTKVGLVVETTGGDTVYITKTALVVEHWAGAWSSVPDDPTNLVAAVV